MLWTVTAALLIAAPAPKDKPAPSLVGEWEVETTYHNGQTFRNLPGELVYTFTADGKWTIGSGTNVGGGGPYAVHPKAVPAEIDLEETKGIPNQLMPGIYRIDGNTLVLCYTNERGGKRPTSFDPPPKGSAHAVFILNRVKPKD